ncbi:potassium voltage-gated channel subfamily H member 6 [Thrips palmi]|uniref:Potassium voltage-gated channel subfamily H member 6 n=1 Tax=Thrips palmi TaxID=161013 RepID=A0A6P8YXY0_THRPL|nr:potassium voltage-gated channel subfamily H member 6 [Thrips palmi]
MAMRRGHIAPKTTLIETIIRKFNTHCRSFVVANERDSPYAFPFRERTFIIYCSDGFCTMSGFSRGEVVQRSAVCDFLHGPLTSPCAVLSIREAFKHYLEQHFEVVYYRKDGTKFLCSETIAPVRVVEEDIMLYIINFDELTPEPLPLLATDPVRLSRFQRARRSFRLSLRGRGFRSLRFNSILSPPAEAAVAEEEGEQRLISSPVRAVVAPATEPGRARDQATAEPQDPARDPTSNPARDATKVKARSTPPETARESVAGTSGLQAAQADGAPFFWEGLYGIPPRVGARPHCSATGPYDPPHYMTPPEPSLQRAPRNVHQSASMDAISHNNQAASAASAPRARAPHVGRPPPRSATAQALSGAAPFAGLDPAFQAPPPLPRPHTIDNICAARAAANVFPNTSSESDLQKYRASYWDQSSRERKSPSLSNLGHKFSIQDNGSAKFFQGVLHTSNMGEKVAQVLSLGADVLPEYKLQSPRMHNWTVLHYSPFKAAWDWLILILVLYTAIFTPYVAAFLLNEPDFNSRKRSKYGDDPIVIIDLIVDVTFIVDILINFRTTYVNRADEVVSHPAKIAIHYFKGWFIIDLVAAIPFDLLLFGSDTDETTTLIGLLKTARLLRLVRVARKIDRYSEYGAAVLLLLMASFALSAHWLACIWYAIGTAERPRLLAKVGWLDALANETHQFYGPNNTGGPSIKSRYITALYFTFSSLTSVGFGNVAPNTDGEKIFTICVMLVGSLMYASIFGNVSAIIQRLYSGTARYHTQMLRVREFVRFHQIPNPLRQRLEEYFQHAWAYTNGIDMNSVLKGFPECLQADICLHLNRTLLDNCSAFEGASPGCLRALSLKFKTTHAPPGDTLVHRGDVLTSLHFISRGSIEILKDDVVMAILGKNDIFGESPCQYATVGKSSCNVRALSYCDLHKIHRDDLLDVLELYPEFYHEFASNLEITFNMRDEDQPGVDPRFLRHRASRCSSSDDHVDGESTELRRAAPRDKAPRKRKATGQAADAARQGGDPDGGEGGPGSAKRKASVPRQASDDTSASECEKVVKLDVRQDGGSRAAPQVAVFRLQQRHADGASADTTAADSSPTLAPQVAELSAKVERLTKHLQRLEENMSNDVRQILALMQANFQSASATAATAASAHAAELAESREVAADSSLRHAHPVQRSSSLPQNTSSGTSPLPQASFLPPKSSARLAQHQLRLLPPPRSQSSPLDLIQHSPSPSRRELSLSSQSSLPASSVRIDLSPQPIARDASLPRESFPGEPIPREPFPRESLPPPECTVRGAPIARLESLDELDKASTSTKSRTPTSSASSSRGNLGAMSSEV